MRKALNENRTVQIAVVGVLALVVAIIFMMNMSGGGADETVDAGDPAESIVDPTDSSVPGSDSADGGTGTVPPVGSDQLTPTASDVPIGPEPPPEVTAAFERGDTIALLVVRDGGHEDRYVENSLAAIRGEPGVSVFVTTTEDVAEYARLTQGAGVTRAPALVVVSPRHLADEVTAAQVHYGLKTPESIKQAVRDASYAGRSTTYAPD